MGDSKSLAAIDFAPLLVYTMVDRYGEARARPPTDTTISGIDEVTTVCKATDDVTLAESEWDVSSAQRLKNAGISAKRGTTSKYKFIHFLKREG